MSSSFRRNAGLVALFPPASVRVRFCCGRARTTRGRVASRAGGQSGCVSREGREEEATTRGVVGRASSTFVVPRSAGEARRLNSTVAARRRRAPPTGFAMARSRWNGDDGTTSHNSDKARERLGAYLSLSDLRRHRARAAAAGNAVPRTLRRPRARRCAMRGTSWFTRAAKRGWLFTLPIVSGKGVRSRLSVTDFRRPSALWRVASSYGERTRRTKEYIHHARTNARVPPHDTSPFRRVTTHPADVCFVRRGGRREKTSS